ENEINPEAGNDSNLDIDNTNEEIVGEDEDTVSDELTQENPQSNNINEVQTEKSQSQTITGMAIEPMNLDGTEIIQLKRDLTTLGFGRFPTNPSQTYGKVTSKELKEFQKPYGLRTDGIINHKTLNALRHVLNNSLKIGDQSNEVIELKKNLTLLGFGRFPSKPSQTYGNVTANVVMDFQQHYKLRLSEVADTIT